MVPRRFRLASVYWMAHSDQQAHVADVVRRNTTPAVIAALLLGYYGFFTLAEPDGTDLYSQCNWLFYHTLRIGGVLMGLMAVWSLTGMALALVVDGVVSMVIGALFALTGGGMLLDGGVGLNTILIIIFGMMFVGAGRRNLLTFRHLSAGGRVSVVEVLTPPPAARPPPTPKPPSTVDAAASQPRSVSPAEHEPELETPPGGFLASLGKRPPPNM